MHTLTWISTCLPKQTSTQTKPRDPPPLLSSITAAFSSPSLRSHFLPVSLFLTCAHWCDYTSGWVLRCRGLFIKLPQLCSAGQRWRAQRGEEGEKITPTQTHWLLRHTATLRKRDREEQNDGGKGKKESLRSYEWFYGTTGVFKAQNSLENIKISVFVL